MAVGAVFDCDGVLLDSANAWRDAEAELGRRAGVQLTAEDSRLLAPMTIAEVGDFFHGRFGLGSSGADVVAMIDEIMLDFYANHAEPLPGVWDFLVCLAERGVVMSVVSSTQSDLLHVGLEHAGFLGFFRSVLSVDDLATSKREPVIYRKAMEDMGTVPASTWGFDDSYYAIETMSKLGMATVGVYDAHRPFELDRLCASADLVTCDYANLDVDHLASGRR